MHTRHLLLFALVASGIGALSASLLVWRGAHREATRPEAARSGELDELRAQLGALQGRVAAAETAVHAPAERAPPILVAPPVSARVAAKEVPTHRTREEASAAFDDYFTTLDMARGSHEDRELNTAFSKALADVNSAFQALKRANIEIVGCGNGLCRIELTVPDAADLRMAQTELLQQIGSTAGGASVHLDGDRPHLTAYFAAHGSTLPPFPSAPE